MKSSKNQTIQGIKITKNFIHFIFPTNIHSIQRFAQFETFIKQLKSEFKANYSQVFSGFPYDIKRDLNSKSSDKVVKLFCKSCQNQIKWIRNSQTAMFQLLQFSVDHIHLANDAKWDGKVQQFPYNYVNADEMIANKISSLSTEVNEDFNSKITRQMGIPNTLNQLILMLKKEEYCVSFEPSNYMEKEYLTFPDYLLIISKQMKKSYLESGRSVGFDFTFSLIKDSPLSNIGNKQYLIGFFAGLTPIRRVTIYGMVVCVEENACLIEKAFTEFIAFMGKEPQNVVTDRGIGMVGAMRNITIKGIFHGQALWDTFHTLKTYRFKHKVLKAHMRKMIREKCQHEFHKMYLQAVRLARTEQQLDAVHEFLHQSSKYCISQIKTTFVGFGVSNSPNEMLNNLVKQEIPIESPYTETVYKCLLFIQELNLRTKKVNRQKCRIQQILGSHQLQIVRYSLCKPAFQFFFGILKRTGNVDIVYANKNKDFYFVQTNTTIHIITKVLIQDYLEFVRYNNFSHIKTAYKCSCNFQYKTGFPCQHILKIVMYNKQSFVDSIYQYWIAQESHSTHRPLKPILTEDKNLHQPTRNSPPKLTLGRVSKVVGQNDGTEFDKKYQQNENRTAMKEFDKSVRKVKSDTQQILNNSIDSSTRNRVRMMKKLYNNLEEYC